MQDSEPHDLSPLMREALDWTLRLTSGAATQADARAFEAWRAQGPEHVAAFQDAAIFRKALRAMPLREKAADNVLPFVRPKRAVVMDRRAMLFGGGAVAASAAMLAINPPFGLWPSLAELRAGERTGLGERKTLQPMAGITLEMNARTAMSVDTIASSAELVTGEAFVSVAARAKPLLMRVRDEAWSIRDADVNVRTGDHEVCVSCMRGHITRADGSVALREGQQYVAATGGKPGVSAIDPSRSGTWRQGVLLFRNTPLARAIEDINRYRDGTIILSSAEVGARTVSGMFHTDKIDNAVNQIQQLLDLKMLELPGNVVIFS